MPQTRSFSSYQILQLETLRGLCDVGLWPQTAAAAQAQEVLLREGEALARAAAEEELRTESEAAAARTRTAVR